MCHLLLVLPILALPVFWLLPLEIAAPLYAVAVGLAGAVYAIAIKSMHAPVTTGKESLIHATGVVEHVADGIPSVLVRGEHWAARTTDRELVPGDRVEIVSLDGLTLRVKHTG